MIKQMCSDVPTLQRLLREAIGREESLHRSLKKARANKKKLVDGLCTLCSEFAHELDHPKRRKK